MTHPLISATFIYDGSAAPIIPERMLPEDRAKIAAKGQMQGTPMEQLVELAGRVCYDSLGVGRPSADYHKHILEVGHLSVLEHAMMTLRFTVRRPEHALELVPAFINRPCVHVRWEHMYSLKVTLNLRTILEWDKQQHDVPVDPEIMAGLSRALSLIAGHLAPAIAGGADCRTPVVIDSGEYLTIASPDDPYTDHEQWATYLLTGSRGFSHELVRHGDWTAFSQRSTRYVDESESPWVNHPLNVYRPFNELDAVTEMKLLYKKSVDWFETWLSSKGVDKLSAKKQSRGAARGLLGNALYTEVVCSASLAQWKHMIRMRACAAADAEIREVFVAVFKDMAVRYAERLTGWTVAPAPDGIGEVVVPA
jgi:thymidylate synthase ThyX